MIRGQSKRGHFGYVYGGTVHNYAKPDMTRATFKGREQHIMDMGGMGILDELKKAKRFAETSPADLYRGLPAETRETIQKVAQAARRLPGSVSTVSNVIKSEAGKLTGSGVSLAGSGVSLAGGALPGDQIRQQLLRKMVREHKMKPFKGRKRTKTIDSISGAGLNIEGTSSGQSRGRSLGSRAYKMNPRPLVGGGVSLAGGAIALIPPSKVIAELKKAAIPFLKAEGLIKQGLANSDKVKRLVELHARKAYKMTDDPARVVGLVLSKLKPLMKGKGVSLAGAGMGGMGIFHRLGWKLLSKIFSIGSSDSAARSGASRFAAHIARSAGSGVSLAGSGKYGGALRLAGQGQDGGFVFTIAAIIAGISAAAAAASASAAAVGAVAVAGTTVGALATGAIAASVTASAGAITGHFVKKALEAGEKAAGRKLTTAEKQRFIEMGKRQAAAAKQRGKGVSLAGSGFNPLNIVKQATKHIKLTLKDFSPRDKKVLLSGFKQLKNDPSKAGIIKLGKKLAPVARNIMFKKVNRKIKKTGVQLVTPEMVVQQGRGVSLAGSGSGVSKVIRLPQVLPAKTINKIKKVAKTFESKFEKAFKSKMTA